MPNCAHSLTINQSAGDPVICTISRLHSRNLESKKYRKVRNVEISGGGGHESVPTQNGTLHFRAVRPTRTQTLISRAVAQTGLTQTGSESDPGLTAVQDSQTGPTQTGSREKYKQRLQ